MTKVTPFPTRTNLDRTKSLPSSFPTMIFIGNWRQSKRYITDVISNINDYHDLCFHFANHQRKWKKKKETRIAFKLLFSHILIFPRRRKCATDFPLWELRRRKWSCTILVTLCRFFFRFFIFFPFYFYLSTALFEFSKMWKNSNDKLMEPYVYLKEKRKTVQNPIIHTKQRYRSK